MSVAHLALRRTGYNSAVSSLLPIFPLDLVLFPGVPLPLHIFEPRYKEMIGEALAEKTLFGVICARGDGVAEVGCTAEIVALTRKHEDGRMDIVTEGRSRFEVVALDQERSFLRAEVKYFEDVPGTTSPAQCKEAVELHQQILSLLEADATTPDAEDPDLSFHLAGSLPLDLDFKQTLLGMRSETERLTAILEFYRAALPGLQRQVKLRHKAGGNGHG